MSFYMPDGNVLLGVNGCLGLKYKLLYLEHAHQSFANTGACLRFMLAGLVAWQVSFKLAAKYILIS